MAPGDPAETRDARATQLQESDRLEVEQRILPARFRIVVTLRREGRRYIPGDCGSCFHRPLTLPPAQQETQ